VCRMKIRTFDTGITYCSHGIKAEETRSSTSEKESVEEKENEGRHCKKFVFEHASVAVIEQQH
jgi:hypothetical protein